MVVRVRSRVDVVCSAILATVLRDPVDGQVRRAAGEGLLAAGVLAGFFGGVGFGAMECATAYADRHPDDGS